MDTIVGALHGKDSLNVEHIMHPQTQIKQVIGLETQLAKAITNLTASGGTITITKGDGSTSSITIATSTSSGGSSVTYNVATATTDGLMSKEMFDKLDKIEAGAQKNSTALATTTSNGLMSKEDKTLLNNLSSSSVTGVKGSAESDYRTGNVNITAANIGLGNVNNTADSAKSVNYANSAGTCTGNAATATKANQLTTARNIQTNLASTAAASFNGTANVTPGVTGILPIANGGTGNSKGKAPSLATTVISNANLNEIVETGIYELYANLQNAPFDGRLRGLLLHLRFFDGILVDHRVQILNEYMSSDFFVRDYYCGIWYEWRKLSSEKVS